MCSGYDFMPTLLDYLGLDNPEADALPGRSFLPSLMEGDQQQDGTVVVFDEYGPARMIRNQKYKYIHRIPYGPDEFYDLEKDPGEEKNRIGDEGYRPLIMDMKRQMEEWFLKYVNPEIDGSLS